MLERVPLLLTMTIMVMMLLLVVVVEKILPPDGLQGINCGTIKIGALQARVTIWKPKCQ